MWQVQIVTCAMPRSRAQVRKDRYALADRLGFTVKEKRRMRDLSDEKFNRLVINAERRLRRVEPIDRSPRVQQRLRALQDYRRERKETPEKVLVVTETKATRINNYSKWSREKDFPPDIVLRIIKINKASGRDPLDAYGFRIWYHIYVTGETLAVSRRKYNSERFNRRDT